MELTAITIADAFAQSEHRSRHLFLGNGFSINARPSFQYRSLFERAQPFSDELAALFDELATEDFERVLFELRLRHAASKTPADERALQAQEAELREAFLRSLSTVHPDHAMLMGPEETEACATFLERFVGRRRPERLRGRIFTTNYDLLLYWVVSRHGRRLICYDSHYRPFPEARYGLWDPEKWPSLVYLHGALHTYATKTGGQGMLRYDGNASLIGQTRSRLNRGSFPVIVAEGTSEAKAQRISESRYLTWASRKLRSSLHDPNGVLFTYGHSLADRDAHLLKKIGSGRVPEVYIGLWGGLDGSEREAALYWLEQWRSGRTQQRQLWPLSVFVFDTALCSPWRPPAER